MEGSHLREYAPEGCKEALVQEEYLWPWMVLLLSFLHPLSTARALPSTSAPETDFFPGVFTSYFPHPASARRG